MLNNLQPLKNVFIKKTESCRQLIVLLRKWLLWGGIWL